MNKLNSTIVESETPATPVPAAAAGASGFGVPFIQQYWQIAVRRRWLILGITAVALILGAIATLLMTPQYTATATIEIQRNEAKVTDFEGVDRDNQGATDQEFYQTQYGLLQARTLAERVAKQLDLVNRPLLFDTYGIKPEGPAFKQVGGRYTADGFATRQRLAGEVLLKHVAIDPTRLSRLVDIKVTSPSPSFSATVANAWAANYIQSNLDRKVQATSYGREQLQRQLAEYKQRLDESQRQLVDYASREQIINLPAQTTGENGQTQERTIVADDLAALNTELIQAKADRIQAQARAQNSGGGASTEALSNPAINELRQRRALLEAQYQELMQRFEPGYPAAVAVKSQIDNLSRSISREEGRVGQSVNADYRAALQRENALQSQVDGLKGQYLDQRRRLIQYNIFQQEVDTNRALYDGLLQRFKEIGIAGGVGVNNISIVDPADEPQGPSSPSLFLNILLSLLLGLGLGAIVALILEQLNEAITDPHEVERRLGLPLLGVVPRAHEGDPRDALLDRKSELTEGYLSVQTNLSFSTEHGVPRSLAVTSTRPAEGKSTTALALAATLARGAAKKVILVDGDMRSPSVHHLAGVNHDRGLSNYLAGEDALDGLIIRMGDFDLDAMTAGPLPPNAAELLTGTRLTRLVELLLEHYDHVIIDSPPVLGLADAPLIASKVEGVVYAVESHRMRSSVVRSAIGRLLSANAHILGVVLTMFEGSESQYGYNYSYSYGVGGTEPKPAR